MSRPVLTYELAHAAGLDAGNRAMRKAGRTAWSDADYNVAAAEFNRLWPDLSPFTPGQRVRIARGVDAGVLGTVSHLEPVNGRVPLVVAGDEIEPGTRCETFTRFYAAQDLEVLS